MERLVNINSENEIIYLKASRYSVYALGGFGVNLGQFSISLRHIETSEIIKCEKVFWSVQTFVFGKRAKRILKIDIPTEGRYEILFNYTETLRIKSSNLPISLLFTKPLIKDNIEILITERRRVYPILK